MTRIITIERRRLLFDEFSSLLASISPDHVGHYACPICLRLFTKADVEIQPGTTDSLLTLEDVIPKRLGKKLYVLTCKDCNNNVGGKALDVHFHKQIEFAEFFATTGKTITVNMLIGGHRLRVE